MFRFSVSSSHGSESQILHRYRLLKQDNPIDCKEDMTYSNLLNAKNRDEFRIWLKANHSTEKKDAGSLYSAVAL